MKKKKLEKRILTLTAIMLISPFAYGEYIDGEEQVALQAKILNKMKHLPDNYQPPLEAKINASKTVLNQISTDVSDELQNLIDNDAKEGKTLQLSSSYNWNPHDSSTEYMCEVINRENQRISNIQSATDSVTTLFEKRYSFPRGFLKGRELGFGKFNYTQRNNFFVPGPYSKHGIRNEQFGVSTYMRPDAAQTPGLEISEKTFNSMITVCADYRQDRRNIEAYRLQAKKDSYLEDKLDILVGLTVAEKEISEMLNAKLTEASSASDIDMNSAAVDNAYQILDMGNEVSNVVDIKVELK